ncbi:MAG: CopG family ribbon-helix-helix protein [Candidatus Hermodarchaeota archaeon]
MRETVTFSVESGFKEQIANKVKELGYSNTSKMIRDALQQFFESEEALIKTKGIVTVIVSVVYDHHDVNTLKGFIELQHHLNVSFSSHSHITEKECLEIILLTASVAEILEFQRKIRGLEGLKYTSVSLVSRANVDDGDN